MAAVDDSDDIAQNASGDDVAELTFGVCEPFDAAGVGNFDDDGLFDSDSIDSDLSFDDNTPSSSGQSTPNIQSVPVTSPNSRRDRNRTLLLKLLKLEQPVLTLQMLDFLCQDDVCKMFLSFIVRPFENDSNDEDSNDDDDHSTAINQSQKDTSSNDEGEKESALTIKKVESDAEDQSSLDADDEDLRAMLGALTCVSKTDGSISNDGDKNSDTTIHVTEIRSETIEIPKTILNSESTVDELTSNTINPNPNIAGHRNGMNINMSPIQMSCAPETCLSSSSDLFSIQTNTEDIQDVHKTKNNDKTSDSSKSSLPVVKETRVFKDGDDEAMRLSHRAMSLLELNRIDETDMGGFGFSQGFLGGSYGSWQPSPPPSESVVGIFVQRKIQQVTKCLFGAFKIKSRANFHHVSCAIKSLLSLRADSLFQIIGDCRETAESYIGSLLPYLHHPPISDLLVDLVCLPVSSSDTVISNSGINGDVMEDQLQAHQCSNRVKWQFYCSLARWRFLVVLAARVHTNDPNIPQNHVETAADTLLQIVDHYCADSSAEIVLQPLGHGLVTGSCCIDPNFQNECPNNSINESSQPYKISKKTPWSEAVLARKHLRERVSVQVLCGLLERADRDQVVALGDPHSVGMANGDIISLVTNQMSSVAELFRAEVLRHIPALLSRLALDNQGNSLVSSEGVESMCDIFSIDNDEEELSSSIILVEDETSTGQTDNHSGKENICKMDEISTSAKKSTKTKNRSDRGFSYTRLAIFRVIVLLAKRHPLTVLDAIPEYIWKLLVSWLFKYNQNNLYHNSFVSLFASAIHADHVPLMGPLPSEGKSSKSNNDISSAWTNCKKDEGLLSTDTDGARGDDSKTNQEKQNKVQSSISPDVYNDRSRNGTIKFITQAINHYRSKEVSAVRGQLLICLNLIRLKMSYRKDLDEDNNDSDIKTNCSSDDVEGRKNSSSGAKQSFKKDTVEMIEPPAAVWLRKRLKHHKIWNEFKQQLRDETVAQRELHFQLPRVDCGYLWITGIGGPGSDVKSAASDLEAEACAAARREINLGSSYARELGFHNDCEDDIADVGGGGIGSPFSKVDAGGAVWCHEDSEDDGVEFDDDDDDDNTNEDVDSSEECEGPNTLGDSSNIP